MKHSGYIKAIIIVVLLILLDRWTKHLASTFLAPDADGIPLIPGVFRLLYLENRGSAFGMMQNRQTFLILFTFVILAAVTYVFVKIPAGDRRMAPLRASIILIYAGAVGNLIDRISQRFVVDFFYFELIDFPIFNVADIYVTCGAILLVFLLLFRYKDEDLAFLKQHNK